ncbi:NUDIX hydrolase [Methanobacterium alcaliphilum]|uniref:NUDIX hydrolase n=1 Tax=Methanobacterium alcaliphilum TaxID=392018 RepID=UPI003183452F
MFNNPLLTVDVVILCRDEKIIMVKRKNNPYKDFWALPGGFVEYGETVEHAACREALEETGLEVELDSLVGVYSEPSRDPRGHVITVCYLAKYKSGKLRADTDAKDVFRFNKSELVEMDLAFDHNKILNDVFQIFENKPEFTINSDNYIL